MMIVRSRQICETLNFLTCK